MKGTDIKIGGIYTAKVSGAIVPLEVLHYQEGEVRAPGGRWQTRRTWTCRNTITGRTIKVRSAQRFRACLEAPLPDCRPPDPAS